MAVETMSSACGGLPYYLHYFKFFTIIHQLLTTAYSSSGSRGAGAYRTNKMVFRNLVYFVCFSENASYRSVIPLEKHVFFNLL